MTTQKTLNILSKTDINSFGCAEEKKNLDHHTFLPIKSIIIEYNPKHDISHVKSFFVSHSIPSVAVMAHRPQMPWLCFEKNVLFKNSIISALG